MGVLISGTAGGEKGEEGLGGEGKRAMVEKRRGPTVVLEKNGSKKKKAHFGWIGVERRENHFWKVGKMGKTKRRRRHIRFILKILFLRKKIGRNERGQFMPNEKKWIIIIINVVNMEQKWMEDWNLFHSLINWPKSMAIFVEWKVIPVRTFPNSGVGPEIHENGTEWRRLLVNNA
jgi:hypothetical protein